VATSPWHVNGFMGWLANGWQVAPIYQWQMGLPFSASSSGTLNSATNRLSGGVNGSNGRFGIGAVGRNSFRLPNTSVVDLSLAKNFPVHERATVELSAQAFNLLNHVNYTSAGTTAYSISSSNVTVNGQTFTCTNTAPCLNPFNSAGVNTFGQLNNANSNFAYTPRQIQLGVRLKF
jgi:hypothetical protein